jgi:5-(aminomethyl)-3-furanmethanol phosphate kinase
LATSSRRPQPFVVKIGGSLARGADLLAWLEALKQGLAAPRPVQHSHFIVVPGGGVLADGVRRLQEELHFDNHVAHHMALLAMEQFGLALASLWPQLTRVATIAAIRRAWRMQKIPWWAPTQMTLAELPAPGSWDVTSDSLAAWLAGLLKADRLLLIKSIDPDLEGEAHCADLVAGGIVDPLFGHFAATSGAEIFMAGPSALANAYAVLADGGMPGARIRLS